MGESDRFRARFEGQALHLGALAALLAGATALALRPGVLQGEFAGLDTVTWLASSLGFAVAHQVYVWAGWRWELHGGALTRLLGPRAFGLYAGGFFLLLLLRMCALMGTAFSGERSIEIPLELRWGLCIAVGLPLPYLGWSVFRHLGWRRIAGVDHFEPALARTGLVQGGIFRWSPNAVYVFGAPSLWMPGLALESSAALIAAAFLQAYIWVHYHCTEASDLRVLYGARPARDSAALV